MKSIPILHSFHCGCRRLMAFVSRSRILDGRDKKWRISFKFNMSPRPVLTYCRVGGGGVGGHSLYLPLSHLQQVWQTHLSDECSLLSLELKQKEEKALNPRAQPPPGGKKTINKYINRLLPAPMDMCMNILLAHARGWKPPQCDE